MTPAQPGDGIGFDGETSVAAAVSAMARVFRAAGIESAEIDARFLVQGILELDAAALFADPGRRLGVRAAQLNEAVRRHLGHEPVSRILGRRDFYGRRFEITPDVLDPRPESETLVEAALEIVDENGWREAPITIADIGTGSGILIITLLALLPRARGIATDVSAAALCVAERNARRIGVGADRIAFTHASGLGSGSGVAMGAIDLVVSNPPYIPTAGIAALDPGVRSFDPLLALDGGGDGLQIYREIANEINWLNCSLWVALEVGAGQADDVAAIFSTIGGRKLKRRADLGGHCRVVALEIHR